MKFTYDTKYIADYEHDLVKQGYAKYTVHSFNFDRYLTEAQKQKNRDFAEKYGTMSDEWRSRCEDTQKDFDYMAKSIMKDIASKYRVEQYNYGTNENPEFVPFETGDFYYYSNKGWNGTDYITYFQLTPRKHELKDYCEFISFLSQFTNDIECRVQFDVEIDNEKLSKYVQNNVKSVTDKMISYCNYKGKIKWVECNKHYGFFKKGARSHYFKLKDTDLFRIIQSA